VSFLVHFSFSIAVAIVYCVLAERFPQVKLWQGALFGVAVWVGFHLVLMPLMGTVPARRGGPRGRCAQGAGHVATRAR
jgi:putative membrane protein